MTADRDEMAERIRAALHPEATDHEFELGLNAAFGRPPLLDFETYSRLPVNDPARIAEKTTRLALSYGTGRPPIAPGLLLDDEPARVYVSRAVLRIVARWAGAIALVGGAVGIMYAEGQRQPSPGVGFGIALALLMGAALLLGRSNDG